MYVLVAESGEHYSFTWFSWKPGKLVEGKSGEDVQKQLLAQADPQMHITED